MRRFLERLFPVVPAPPFDRRRAVLIVLVLVAGVSISLLRQAGAPAVDTIWAEDGKEFLADAIADGPLAVVFRPYNYLHLAPRLVAAVVVMFPVGWAALLFAVLGAAAIVGCGLFVFHAARGHIPSPWVRGALAAWFVLLPTAALETMNQVTNLHWYLFVVAFWALLWRPTTTGGRVAAVLAVTLAALSNPVVLVLAPIAIIRLVVVGRKADMLAPATLLVLGVLQAAVMLGPGSAAAGARPSWSLVVELTANRFAGGTVFGHTLHAWLFARVQHWIALAAVVVLAVLVVLLARRRADPAAVWGVVALLLAPVLFAALVYVRGSAEALIWTSETQGIAGARYTVAPALLVASAVALLLGSLPRRGAVTVVLAGALLVPVGLDFRLSNARSDGPRWSVETATAAATCQTASPETIVTPRYPPGWGVDIPCRRFGTSD